MPPEKTGLLLKIIQKMKLATYWFSISFALTSPSSSNQESFQADYFKRERCTNGTCLKRLFSSSIFWIILDLRHIYLFLGIETQISSCLLLSEVSFLYHMGEEAEKTVCLGVSLQSSLGLHIFFFPLAAPCSLSKVTTPGRENLQNLY